MLLTTDMSELQRATRCLALELPATVYDDYSEMVLGFIQRLINASPDCPTCEASGLVRSSVMTTACPDCTDGKMDPFRALAIARTVMDDQWWHDNWNRPNNTDVAYVRNDLQQVRP